MRLGLVTDVHNHAAELATALALFREHHVEEVHVLQAAQQQLSAIAGRQKQ